MITWSAIKYPFHFAARFPTENMKNNSIIFVFSTTVPNWFWCSISICQLREKRERMKRKKEKAGDGRENLVLNEANQ